ncbi:MAG: CBS domain-containing protein, partial [Deltaproteobacteria bacterium]|nr:CBS domain-containing protein [Deltaproteobacteria bacterium]
KVITISSNAFVSDAEKIMLDHNIRRLPVVDHGHLLGLVTQKDLIKLQPSTLSYTGAFETKYIIGNTLMKDVMVKTKNLTTVTPDTTIEAAVHLGQKHQVGVLPVVDKYDKKKLVGIITVTDLFNLAVQWMGFETEGIWLHISDYPNEKCQKDVISILLSENICIQSLARVITPATGEEGIMIKLDTYDATEIVDQLRTWGYAVKMRPFET